MSSEERHVSSLLMSLELQLMDPAFRRDSEKVSALLVEEFREFGSSGRVWSRAKILELLAAEKGYVQPTVEEFQMQAITSDAVLVTYRTVGEGAVALRSSLWVCRGGDWQMLFHQGTRVS